MKKHLLIIALEIFIAACDPHSMSHIKNESGEDVIVIAQLDTSITSHFAVSNLDFLKSYADDSVSFLLEIDTARLTGKYLLKNNSSIEVDGGNIAHPSTKFRYLEIQKSKDTIRYQSNSDIQEAFTEDVKPTYHELIIK